MNAAPEILKEQARAAVAAAPVPTRAQLDAYEDSLVAQIRSGARPLLQFRTRHYFADDNRIYAREITIPAGAELTGLEHNCECLNVVSKGRILVACESGRRLIVAGEEGSTFVSPPGTKRAGYAIEETIYTTFHANPDRETDIAKIEARLVKPTRPELAAALEKLQPENTLCLSSQ